MNCRTAGREDKWKTKALLSSGRETVRRAGKNEKRNNSTGTHSGTLPG